MSVCSHGEPAIWPAQNQHHGGNSFSVTWAVYDKNRGIISLPGVLRQGLDPRQGLPKIREEWVARREARGDKVRPGSSRTRAPNAPSALSQRQRLLGCYVSLWQSFRLCTGFQHIAILSILAAVYVLHGTGGHEAAIVTSWA